MAVIIAEAGVNHSGDLGLAHELIDAAVESGADAVKFQTYNAVLLEPPGEYREMLKKYQLSMEAHFKLKKYADLREIEFISTPFDPGSLRFLTDEIGVETLKIASGQHGNKPLLEAAGKSYCNLILSTGMASLDDIALAMSFIRREVALLHCTSAYPCSYEDVNLRAMLSLKIAGSLRERAHNITKIGLSDHSNGIAVPIAAVALGAEIIEKHLTLDRNAGGPDHRASIEPNEFAEMVRGIRQVEMAMGDGIKKPRKSERAAIEIMERRNSWREVQNRCSP